MGWWDTRRQLCNRLCANATQSVRRLAQQTGLSTSRVPRLPQALARRNRPPASGFWDTAAGRQWLPRLVVATLSPGGLTRGVGRDTMRAVVSRVPLETPRGCAPAA